MAENGNTNLSTLLLLGVLIFLIYCLMKQPTQVQLASQESANRKGKGTESDSARDSDSDSDRIEPFEAISEDELSSASEKPKARQESARNVRDFSVKAPKVPEISEDVVNKLVSESKGSSAVNSTLLGTGNSVFTFEPSDDNSHSGASLDNAFERPVTDKEDTDVIDLNKNNVTKYSASDYLPKEVNDDWFNTDFSQAKYKMNDDKLINTDKYIIGINTVGQSLKNASYDIRGSVNVPKYTVSPWNNSTIEPDYNIKPLC
jgi:hypothetical protein